ncbi:MAG: flagellar basal body rod protein FlgC [Thermodesulfovibrionales bacterium]
MDTFNLLKVSASAMAAQRERMNAIASNMANVNSTRTEEGGPYKRRDVIFSTMPVGGNPEELDGVQVEAVIKDDRPPRMVYDPGHPDADKDGFVAMPDINIIEEMVNMMTAFRAYEAAVATFNTSKAMFLKTLELGKQ